MSSMLNIPPRPPVHRANDLKSIHFIVWLLHWLAYVLACVWLGLIFGLIGTAFFGWLLNFVHIKILGWSAQELAWIGFFCVGVLVALFGTVRVWKFKVNRRPPLRPMSKLPDLILMDRVRPGRLLWVTSEAKEAAILGGIVGLILGVILLSSWFSIAMSPFAPDSWADSVRSFSASTDHMGRTVPGGLSSDHPSAVIAILGPPIVLASLGFIIGGFRGIFNRWLPSNRE
jgi:hypothetical protein